MKEGMAFLDVYTNYPSLYHSFREASLGVWGTLGLLAILIGIVSMILDGGRIKILLNEPDMHVSKVIIMSSIITIVIYALLYLKLPNKAEYLIPAIPFVLILFSILLTRKVFILVCLLMVMSPFVLSYDKKQVQPYGMIFDNHFKRIEQIQFVDRLFEVVDNLPEENIVVVSGWFLPQIRALISTTSDEKKMKDVIYIYLLDESQLSKFISEGYQIYYIHVDREFTIQKHNLEVYGVDLEKAGCKPLVIN
jgi:xanthosine utilization system XapX-like protein